MLSAALALAVAATPAYAAIAQSFSPPSTSPTATSTNYTGASNGTIVNSALVAGKSFDRFIQIWLENTDYATAASSPVFQNLSTQGLLLSNYYGVTHPSEPNYIASVGGDFFGLGDDDFYAIPSNVSTIVDLLEAKNISWSSYQESMPYDGFTGFNYTEENYLTGNGSYTYYVRKHNPLIIYDSVASVDSRALRIRNFNDFAKDVDAGAMSQWSFITPNLVNDAHDSTIDFTSAWLEYFLVPLLSNENFNNNRTLIVLTFDETETYTINNQVYTLVLGGGLPSTLKNTVDPTYYTHYSLLSTVEANWGLGSLGRGDTNKTMNNVFEFVANTTGYVNNGLTNISIPLTNITGTIPGALNEAYWIPILSPNVTAVGAGGGAVFTAANNNASLTVAPAPLNLTTDPESKDPGYNYAGGSLSIVSATATAAASGSAAATTAAKSGAERIAAPITGLLALAAALLI